MTDDETVEFLNGLLGQGAFNADTAGGGGGRLVERGLTDGNYYAVHDSDVDLLAMCLDVVKSLPDLLTNPLSPLVELVSILLKYRRKRATLTAVQGVILLTLKESPGGLSIATVVRRFNARLRSTSRTASKLNETQVQATLRALGDVRTADSKATSFVAEHDGRWYAVDV